MSTQGTGPDLDARLRAADPAADAEPDLTALRAAIRARTAAGDAPASGAEPDAAEVDELAGVRARRRSWPVRVASVAAAALVVGAGGGYAVGAAGDGSGPAAPAVTLEQPAAAGDPSMGGAGPEIAMGGPDLLARGSGGASTEAADAAGSWGYGRTVFDQSGLSTERGTGRAWGFDTEAAWTADALRTAASALGLDGEPQQVGTTWRVGSVDGTGPSAELYADGTVSFAYWDPSKDPWQCSASVEPRPLPEPDAATSSAEPAPDIMPVEPCAERDLGPAPQGDAATTVLRDTLAAMGVAVEEYEFAVEGQDTGPWSYVTAHQVLDGRRTGAQWGASLTGAGLSSLHGQTAPLVDLGEYAVISPAEAVERLMDPRFGSTGPVAWADGREPAMPMEEPAGPARPPATPSAGQSLSWPVDLATIVEANLASAMHWTPDGAAMLVPTYELVDTRGAVWTVIAVADEHLDMGRR